MNSISIKEKAFRICKLILNLVGVENFDFSAVSSVYLTKFILYYATLIDVLNKKDSSNDNKNYLSSAARSELLPEHLYCYGLMYYRYCQYSC